MRRFHSKLPIYIFALALTCGGLFFVPAKAHAAETISTETVQTTENTTTANMTDTEATEDMTSSDESLPQDNESENSASTDIQENPSQGGSSSDGIDSSNDSSENNQNPDTTPESSDSNGSSANNVTSGTQKPASGTTSEKTSSKKSRKNANLNRWLNVCKTMGKNLRKRRFTYSNHGTRSTYKAAVSSGKKSNCALYVSWCLQQYGALKKGKTFYVRSSGSLKKNFGKWGKKVKVIRVNRSCSSANLEPGDVVCWAGIAHCNIYAGRNNSGDRLWYDAGKSATYSGHSGSRYENVGAKTQGYLDSKRVSYIIRIKDL